MGKCKGQHKTCSHLCLKNDALLNAMRDLVIELQVKMSVVQK